MHELQPMLTDSHRSTIESSGKDEMRQPDHTAQPSNVVLCWLCFCSLWWIVACFISLSSSSHIFWKTTPDNSGMEMQVIAMLRMV